MKSGRLQGQTVVLGDGKLRIPNLDSPLRLTVRPLGRPESYVQVPQFYIATINLARRRFPSEFAETLKLGPSREWDFNQSDCERE